MEVIKVYEPCVNCYGTGKESNLHDVWDCRICDGHGENLVTTRKEFADGEEPERQRS